MRRPPVRLDRAAPITQDEQLEAATTVWEYKAAQVLHARQEGNLNEVPDSDWFRETFTFTHGDLREYIKTHPDLIVYLLDSSLDQRGGFYSVFEETSDGFTVGFYDRRRQKTRLFDDPFDAAAEYILLYWRMMPLEE